mgnify:CR=1 FL=1
MNINISGHNREVDEKLKSYTLKKLKKLDNYSDYITSTHITFRSDKLKHIAEGLIHVSGAEIHATSEHETSHGAMDGLIDRLIKQLKKHKEKNIGRR